MLIPKSVEGYGKISGKYLPFLHLEFNAIRSLSACGLSAYEMKNKDWQDSGDVSQDNFNTLMPGQSAKNVAKMPEIIAWHQTRDAPSSEPMMA